METLKLLSTKLNNAVRGLKTKDAVYAVVLKILDDADSFTSAKEVNDISNALCLKYNIDTETIEAENRVIERLKQLVSEGKVKASDATESSYVMVAMDLPNFDESDVSDETLIKFQNNLRIHGNFKATRNYDSYMVLTDLWDAYNGDLWNESNKTVEVENHNDIYDKYFEFDELMDDFFPDTDYHVSDQKNFENAIRALAKREGWDIADDVFENKGKIVRLFKQYFPDCLPTNLFADALVGYVFNAPVLDFEGWRM